MVLIQGLGEGAGHDGIIHAEFAIAAGAHDDPG